MEESSPVANQKQFRVRSELWTNVPANENLATDFDPLRLPLVERHLSCSFKNYGSDQFFAINEIS